MEALTLLIETLQDADAKGADPAIDFIFKIKRTELNYEHDDSMPLMVPYSAFEEAIREHHQLPAYIYIKSIESGYPSSTATPFRSSRTQMPYTLLALYFYMDLVIRRRTPGGFKTYMGACKALGLESVSFVDMKILNAFYETKSLSTLMVEEARRLYIKPITLSELGMRTIGEKRPFENDGSSEQPQDGKGLEVTKEGSYKMARYQEDQEGLSIDRAEGEKGQVRMRSERLQPSVNFTNTTATAAVSTLDTTSPIEKAMYGKQVRFQVPSSVPTKGLGTLIQMLKGVLRQAEITVKSVPLKQNLTNASTMASAASAAVIGSHSLPSTTTTSATTSGTSTLLPASVGPVNLQDPKSLLHHLSAMTSQDISGNPSPPTTTTKPTSSIARPLRQASIPRPLPPSTSAASTLPIPIILVPAAPTAILSLYNIQSFLQEETFIAQDVARLQAPLRKPSLVTVNRPSHYQRPLASLYLPPSTYHVLDSPLTLQPHDW
jgi:RNA pol II accessory factor, Cdc73 family, C-terminal